MTYFVEYLHVFKHCHYLLSFFETYHPQCLGHVTWDVTIYNMAATVCTVTDTLSTGVVMYTLYSHRHSVYRCGNVQYVQSQTQCLHV